MTLSLQSNSPKPISPPPTTPPNPEIDTKVAASNIKHKTSITTAKTLPLNPSQIEQRNKFRDAVYEIHPRNPEEVDKIFKDAPSIKFTIKELHQYFLEHLPQGKIDNDIYLTGGAASNVLSGLDYADVDICVYLETDCLKTILPTLIGFFHAQLLKIDKIKFSSLKTPNLVFTQYLGKMGLIKEDTLANGTIIKKDIYAFYNLGEHLQFKFIYDLGYIRTIAATDGFNIGLFDNDNYFCIDGYTPCNDKELELAIRNLEVRNLELKLKDKNGKSIHRRDFILRLAHKANRGFQISLEAIQEAAKSLIIDFPEANQSFKDKLTTHFKDHYFKEANAPKYDLLNLFLMLQFVENKDKRQEYTTAVIEVWKSLYKDALKTFIAFISKKNADISTLLKWIHTLCFIAWCENKKNICAFPSFKKAEQKFITGSDLNANFEITSSNGKYYLFHNQDPLQLMTASLEALKKNNKIPDNLKEIAAEFEIPLPTSKEDHLKEVILDSIYTKSVSDVFAKKNLQAIPYFEALLQNAHVDQPLLEPRLLRLNLLKRAKAAKDLNQKSVVNLLLFLANRIKNKENTIDLPFLETFLKHLENIPPFANNDSEKKLNEFLKNILINIFDDLPVDISPGVYKICYVMVRAFEKTKLSTTEHIGEIVVSLLTKVREIEFTTVDLLHDALDFAIFVKNNVPDIEEMTQLFIEELFAHTKGFIAKKDNSVLEKIKFLNYFYLCAPTFIAAEYLNDIVPQLCSEATNSENRKAILAAGKFALVLIKNDPSVIEKILEKSFLDGLFHLDDPKNSSDAYMIGAELLGQLAKKDPTSQIRFRYALIKAGQLIASEEHTEEINFRFKLIAKTIVLFKPAADKKEIFNNFYRELVKNPSTSRSNFFYIVIDFDLPVAESLYNHKNYLTGLLPKDVHEMTLKLTDKYAKSNEPSSIKRAYILWEDLKKSHLVNSCWDDHLETVCLIIHGFVKHQLDANKLSELILFLTSILKQNFPDISKLPESRQKSLISTLNNTLHICMVNKQLDLAESLYNTAKEAGWKIENLVAKYLIIVKEKLTKVTLPEQEEIDYALQLFQDSQIDDQKIIVQTLIKLIEVALKQIPADFAIACRVAKSILNLKDLPSIWNLEIETELLALIKTKKLPNDFLKYFLEKKAYSNFTPASLTNIQTLLLNEHPTLFIQTVKSDSKPHEKFINENAKLICEKKNKDLLELIHHLFITNKRVNLALYLQFLNITLTCPELNLWPLVIADLNTPFLENAQIPFEERAKIFKILYNFLLPKIDGDNGLKYFETLAKLPLLFFVNSESLNEVEQLELVLKLTKLKKLEYLVFIHKMHSFTYRTPLMFNQLMVSIANDVQLQKSLWEEIKNKFDLSFIPSEIQAGKNITEIRHSIDDAMHFLIGVTLDEQQDSYDKLSVTKQINVIKQPFIYILTNSTSKRVSEHLKLCSKSNLDTIEQMNAELLSAMTTQVDRNIIHSHYAIYLNEILKSHCSSSSFDIVSKILATGIFSGPIVSDIHFNSLIDIICYFQKFDNNPDFTTPLYDIYKSYLSDCFVSMCLYIINNNLNCSPEKRIVCPHKLIRPLMRVITTSLLCNQKLFLAVLHDLFLKENISSKEIKTLMEAIFQPPHKPSLDLLRTLFYIPQFKDKKIFADIFVEFTWLYLDSVNPNLVQFNLLKDLYFSQSGLEQYYIPALQKSFDAYATKVKKDLKACENTPTVTQKGAKVTDETSTLVKAMLTFDNILKFMPTLTCQKYTLLEAFNQPKLRSNLVHLSILEIIYETITKTDKFENIPPEYAKIISNVADNVLFGYKWEYQNNPVGAKGEVQGILISTRIINSHLNKISFEGLTNHSDHKFFILRFFSNLPFCFDAIRLKGDLSDYIKFGNMFFEFVKNPVIKPALIHWFFLLFIKFPLIKVDAKYVADTGLPYQMNLRDQFKAYSPDMQKQIFSPRSEQLYSDGILKFLEEYYKLPDAEYLSLPDPGNLIYMHCDYRDKTIEKTFKAKLHELQKKYRI